MRRLWWWVQDWWATLQARRHPELQARLRADEQEAARVAHGPGAIGDGYDAARLEAATRAWKTGQTVFATMGPCEQCDEVRVVEQQNGRWLCADHRV